ncbi:low molecular weight protein-tyrosine-phosphatase [Halomonas sp. LR5S13]|uniref:low molecular weight protein-tyrosine-phosphatase n=1 Tax=Halomonas rhizosphaerae TaxID=3043296 RepID=UPI0024A9B12F|nr:low molecular weight protein-tyrosine-phosphatase [Halomonas rhizosphaerae]MDI5921009.1 low molecular weight protein-tyrosine-phosphatase [Halomonas rhizosphaerae]
MFHHILVVCTGNICRSPVAAAMLARALPEHEVASAGLGALVGQGVEPTARALAEADGLVVSEHRARQLTPEMISGADIVLVMSDGQRQAVGELVPEALGKSMLLGHWLGERQERQIPDPYRKSTAVFEEVHRLLREACSAWSTRLR